MDKVYEQIKCWKKKNIIVTVSAASNVTSQVTDLKSLNGVISKFLFYFQKN
jgi:selenocysteine lyase/cysteine desulfurase